MSVGLLVVTHEDIGAQLIAASDIIFKQRMTSIKQISIPADLSPEQLGKFADLIRITLQDLDNDDGVLVLTDVYGATPDNLARYFSNDYNARVVSGINLPMLLRVLNYAHQSLEQLSETALNGGRSGVRQGTE
ncbi:MAG: PTS fructose transporter subunit IIA [Gammaproteobacteria bacterium]|nr:PTS fructose transporter subunit IIA [Gammaproteobacteria bacterium]